MVLLRKNKQKKPLFKKWWLWAIVAVLAISALGPGEENGQERDSIASVSPSPVVSSTKKHQDETSGKESESAFTQENPETSGTILKSEEVKTLDFSSVPEYSGTPYVKINNNVPYFNESGLTTSAFETYSELDSLGRCGVAYACIGKEIMPTEPRGDIGSVKPSGWHTVRYDDIIKDKYLYNRCHLIGYQLSGENANTKNLITGTRYLNVEGMLPFEDLTDDYIEDTNNHVMYRVTPIFVGDELVARGVLMEGKSVESSDVSFCVYCYNVQPGVTIDYATGESSTYETAPISQDTEAYTTTTPPAPAPVIQPPTETTTTEQTYVLNRNTKKFHYPYCSSAKKIANKNREEYSGSRDSIISNGYSPCKNCDP